MQTGLFRTAAFLILLSGVRAFAADSPTAEQIRFFESSIRPVLVEHCLKCHGPEKQWSKFRVDSRAALLAGGDIGEAIVPGKPAESRLIQAVKHVDKDLRMPPPDKGARLSDRQIADLVRWVEM